MFTPGLPDPSLGTRPFIGPDALAAESTAINLNDDLLRTEIMAYLASGLVPITPPRLDNELDELF